MNIAERWSILDFVTFLFTKASFDQPFNIKPKIKPSNMKIETSICVVF